MLYLKKKLLFLIISCTTSGLFRWLFTPASVNSPSFCNLQLKKEKMKLHMRFSSSSGSVQGNRELAVVCVSWHRGAELSCWNHSGIFCDFRAACPAENLKIPFSSFKEAFSTSQESNFLCHGAVFRRDVKVLRQENIPRETFRNV